MTLMITMQTRILTRCISAKKPLAFAGGEWYNKAIGVALPIDG